MENLDSDPLYEGARIVPETEVIDLMPVEEDSQPPVVAPKTPIVSWPVLQTSVKEEVSSDAPGKGYYIQLGAFGKAENAHRLQEKVSTLGNAVIIPKNANGQSLLHVRMGPYKTRQEAHEMLDTVARAGYSEVRIILEE